MTLDEIRKKADFAIKEAQEAYRNEVVNYLVEHNLRKVIRVRDRKVGYLYVEPNFEIKVGYALYFYPLKKDGTESKKYELVYYVTQVETDFIPYEDN